MATLAELALALSDATGEVYTAVDIACALRERHARGSSNYVVRVVRSNGAGAVALRVAHGKTNAADVVDECALGKAAFDGGFGLEPLFTGKIQTKRGVRSASCWPWGTCLTRAPAVDSTGQAVLRALRAASSTMLALDASAVRNHVLIGATSFLIDFDPYFTRIVASDEQCAASRGFVAVAMALIRSQMPIFSVEQIELETGTADPAALCDRLADAVARVAECFPDATRAMICIVQMYAAHGLSRDLGIGHTVFDAMKDANDPDGAERLVAAGSARSHALLFMRAAFGVVTPTEFSDAYTAQFAPFFVEHCSSDDSS
jgi:hypothetical protein